MIGAELRRWRALWVAILLIAGMMALLMAAFHFGSRAGAIDEALDYQRELLSLRSEQLYALNGAQRIRRVQALMTDQPRGREILVILGQQGESLAGPAIAPVTPDENRDFFVWRSDRREEVVGVVRPLPERGQRLFIGATVDPYRERVWQDWKILWIAALALGVPTIFWLVYARRRLESRIAVMSETFRQIGQGAMDVRIPQSAHHDEIDRIALQVNGMLDRLGKLMSVLEDQSTHIRHEFLNGAARMAVYVRRVVDAGVPLDPVVEGAIAAIERERIALVASTEAILRLSQARSENQQFREQDVSVLAGEVADMLETRADQKNIGFSTDLETGLVAGDAGMLTLMLSNLVENAIKYTPEEGQMMMSCGIADDSVWLRIEDSGPGIPTDMRLSVFEPRLRIASTEDEQGHGYGLAIVKAIVTQHRGSIMIEDSALGGACFRLTLPAYSGDDDTADRSRST